MVMLSKDEIKDQVMALAASGYSDRDQREVYFKGLWTRYNARHSITADFSTGKKNIPWEGASNIGYFIEQIVVEALVPRFIRVTVNSDKLIQVSKKTGNDIKEAIPLSEKAIKAGVVEGDPIQLAQQVESDPKLKKDLQNELIRKYREDGKKISNLLNFQAFSDEWGLDIEQQKELCYRIALVEGCCIEKMYWEKVELHGFRSSEKLVFDNSGEELPTDEEGLPIMPANANGEPLFDESEFKTVKTLKKESEIIKDRPQLKAYSLSDFIIPSDEEIISDDPDDWPWIGHIYTKTLHEIKSMIGDNDDPWTFEYDKKEVDRLIDTQGLIGNKKNGDDRTKLTQDLNKPIEILEWHGKLDMDGDGILEDVEVHIAEKEHVLGWKTQRFPRKPFFNTILFPKFDGPARGLSVVEIIWSVRNWLDKVINLLNDHNSITVAPPILFGRGHGFDIADLKYGLGQRWQCDDVNQVRELQISRTDINAMNILEILLGIAQKIFGVTDFTLGSESDVSSNSTATGITSIIQEGNIKFDHLINRLQRVNRKEFQHLHKLNILFLDDGFEFAITDGDIPYEGLDKSLLAGEFDFKMTGNTLNVNDRVEQERAMALFNLYLPLYIQQIPLVTDNIMKEVLEMVNDSFSFRIKIPTIEELKQARVEIQKKAVKQAQTEDQASQLKQASESGKISDEEAKQEAIRLAESLENKG